MSGRPRTSTLVISGLFLAVLALYILVRPVPPPASMTSSRSRPVCAARAASTSRSASQTTD